MDGTTLRAIREYRGETQDALAKFLNGRFFKKYDKSTVSRWEAGSDSIPVAVSNALYFDTMKFTRNGKCKVVSVCLRKGGTSKTQVASSLGYVLSRANGVNRICLIDADSQSNLCAAVGITRDVVEERDAAGKSLYHVLMGTTDIRDAVIPTPYRGIDIIPSAVSLAFSERELIIKEHTDGISANNTLRDILTDDFKSKYDFLVIDCQPSLGVATLNAICASDFILYAVQTESYAVEAMDHLTDIIEVLRKKGNPDIRVLGVVPTLFTSRQLQDKASLDEIRVKAALIKNPGSVGVRVFDPMPRHTLFAQASAANLLAYHVEPQTPGIETFIQIAHELGVETFGGN